VRIYITVFYWFVGNLREVLVPRRGRRTFHILILLQILILVAKYKSGPESGPRRSEVHQVFHASISS
jgi:hypothetical protein